MKDSAFQSHPQRKGQYRRAWKESHGSAIIAFAFLILVVGMLLIWAQPPAEEDPDLNLLVDVAVPQAPILPPDALLVRVVTDKVDSDGPIRIAIYDSKASFGNPEKAILRDSLTPIEGFVIWEIPLSALPEEFSIAAFHDLDGNGELNRALLNVPVEPYGFSNNARSLVGPPTYEETIMNRPSESSAIEVRVY